MLSHLLALSSHSGSFTVLLQAHAPVHSDACSARKTAAYSGSLLCQLMGTLLSCRAGPAYAGIQIVTVTRHPVTTPQERLCHEPIQASPSRSSRRSSHTPRFFADRPIVPHKGRSQWAKERQPMQRLGVYQVLST